MKHRGCTVRQPCLSYQELCGEQVAVVVVIVVAVIVLVVVAVAVVVIVVMQLLLSQATVGLPAECEV